MQIDPHVKLEIEREINKANRFSTSEANKARNTAIGVLAFAALVLSLAGYLTLDSIAREQINDTKLDILISEANDALTETQSYRDNAKEKLAEFEELIIKHRSLIEELIEIRGKYQNDISAVSSRLTELESGVVKFGSNVRLRNPTVGRCMDLRADAHHVLQLIRCKGVEVPNQTWTLDRR